MGKIDAENTVVQIHFTTVGVQKGGGLNWRFGAEVG